MSDLLNLLGIGKSALRTAQRALSVTGQNIANVNTPGYARQEAVLAAARPLDSRPGQLGTGVEVTQIRRSVDAVVERQLLGSRAQLGNLEVTKRTLLRIEGLFGDTSEQRIGAALNDFFAAWQDVATDPADRVARSVLLSKAAALADRVNRTAADLADTRTALDREVRDTLTEINALAKQIAALNGRIVQAKAGGQNPNDLLDQRGHLVGELADRIAVSTVEDDQGRLTVFAGRGRALVAGDEAYRLVGQANADNDGLLDVAYDPTSPAEAEADEDQSPVVISSEIGGGRLKGLLTTRDATLAGLLDSLNSLAAALVSEVNDRHAAGYGLDGSTGKEFFDATGTTAATMRVALTDPNEVAASDSAAGVPGDGANALAIVALQSTALSALDDLTMSQYDARTAANLGATANQADGDLKAQQVIQDQLQAARAEVSGVSLDEELVNLLAQQRAFEAASRVVVMTDELLQTILSLKR
ncbi:flagellar hook-associated protein FlgK [Nitrospira sp. Kam-Ns4a]